VTTDNANLIRRSYEAFADGDVPTVLGILSPNITWHVPGRSQLSGHYKGHDEVVGFFTTCLQLSDGTLRVDVDEIVAAGETVIALTTVSATRKGRAWSSPEVHVWRVQNGLAIDFCEFQGDQQTEDEFWLS
jgi:ketosteroid isomerase-like protein